MTRAGKGKEKGESEYGASRRNAVRRRKSEAKNERRKGGAVETMTDKRKLAIKQEETPVAG